MKTPEVADELFGKYPKTVLKRFKEYHANNPDVYTEFKRIALEMKNTGRKKYSAETIINVIRWHFDLRTSGDVFKINNDFKPLYVRLLIYNHPEFANFFELRTPTSRDVQSQEQKARQQRKATNDKSKSTNQQEVHSVHHVSRKLRHDFQEV